MKIDNIELIKQWFNMAMNLIHVSNIPQIDLGCIGTNGFGFRHSGDVIVLGECGSYSWGI